MRRFYFLTIIFALAAAPSHSSVCLRWLTGDVTQAIVTQKVTPQTLSDPVIARAIELKLFEDFKLLVDRVPKTLTREEQEQIAKTARQIENEKERIVYLIESQYEAKRELLPLSNHFAQPKITVKAGSLHKKTVDYIEATWDELIRITPRETNSTLIPLPHPITIPGSRFQEAYYWDSFFAVQALIKTGRAPIVKGQIENFLYMIRNYGLVPNGNRSYYLTRSQPPLLTHMIRKYLEANGQVSNQNISWLREEVMPTLKKDYFKFWMNPKTRYDSGTGLNHHHSPNLPRPERHATDQEEALGKTYRDVRAEAESGKDFTAAFEGEASQYAGVLLNSILYLVEMDLAWFSRVIGEPGESLSFLKAAMERKAAMKKYLRDPSSGLYFDYHLKKKRRSPVLTADTFIPLYLDIVDSSEKDRFIRQALSRLESKGGILSSEVASGKQWDAPYGWAPHLWFAVEGLRKAGHPLDAERVARKWVETVDRVFEKEHAIFEKYDMVRADLPIETGKKYPTQQGFLWTNGVYLWFLNNVLGEPLIPAVPDKN